MTRSSNVVFGLPVGSPSLANSLPMWLGLSFGQQAKLAEHAIAEDMANLVMAIREPDGVFLHPKNHHGPVERTRNHRDVPVNDVPSSEKDGYHCWLLLPQRREGWAKTTVAFDDR